jgi:hypothetical protein
MSWSIVFPRLDWPGYEPAKIIRHFADQVTDNSVSPYERTNSGPEGEHPSIYTHLIELPIASRDLGRPECAKIHPVFGLDFALIPANQCIFCLSDYWNLHFINGLTEFENNKT